MTIQTFDGPLYIGHPYGGKLENVAIARSLSCAVRAYGVATFSPLQESIGAEDTLSETEWLAHGLATLPACRGIVLPDYWAVSYGCGEEHSLARYLHRPIYEWRLIDGVWVPPKTFLADYPLR